MYLCVCERMLQGERGLKNKLLVCLRDVTLIIVRKAAKGNNKDAKIFNTMGGLWTTEDNFQPTKLIILITIYNTTLIYGFSVNEWISGGEEERGKEL